MADDAVEEFNRLISSSSTGEADDPVAAFNKLLNGGETAPQHGWVKGVASQALDSATLNLSKNFKSKETLAADKRFARENPVSAFGGQAVGFIAPMFTPAGWVSRTPAAVAKVAEWALPFANFNKALAPGVGTLKMLHNLGAGAAKTGAWMRFNEPPEAQQKTGDAVTDTLRNLAARGDAAGDLKSMALDYGLGAGAGWAGSKVGGAIGGATQKIVDQIPRFSWNRGTAGNGFYDWTRGGAQRAHEAFSGDLRPGQTLEEAATHGLLGDFKMLQPATGTRGGFSRQPAPHAYKMELAQRYYEALDNGLTPAAARAKVAQDILADPALVAKYNLRGGRGAPKPKTIQDHVNKVAAAADEARQFPTTMQERVAMSQGGETGKGAPTYGAAPNSHAAIDEMLTSPGSKDPGSARATATNWIQQRQQGQNERVITFLNEKLGEADVHKALAAHEARKAAAYDLYDPAIANWKADPKAPQALQDAIAGALRNWRARPENQGLMTTVSRDIDKTLSSTFETPLQIVSPTGQVGMKQIVTPNDLQKFIAQRSNFVREAEKIKLSDPSQYRAMKQFQKDHLDAAVRPLAPDWARANDLAADTWALRRAFTEGESFPLGASSRQAEKLAAFRKLEKSNPDAAELWKAGFNAQLQKRLNGKTSTGDQHVLFSKKETGDALRAIMGEEAGNAALRQLQAVAAATRTNKIFAQSATHGREAEERANSNILKLIQSVGNAVAHPLHGLGEIAKWGGEKMATEAGRARNDRALRIMTANTDDMSNYFKQLKDVVDSGQNFSPAVIQRLDELLRKIGATTGGYSASSRP